MGTEGIHEGAQTEYRACYQGVVEVELGEDCVADCGEGGVFHDCVFLQFGEMDGGEYY